MQFSGLNTVVTNAGRVGARSSQMHGRDVYPRCPCECASISNHDCGRDCLYAMDIASIAGSYLKTIAIERNSPGPIQRTPAGTKLRINTFKELSEAVFVLGYRNFTSDDLHVELSGTDVDHINFVSSSNGGSYDYSNNSVNVTWLKLHATLRKRAYVGVGRCVKICMQLAVLGQAFKDNYRKYAGNSATFGLDDDEYAKYCEANRISGLTPEIDSATLVCFKLIRECMRFLNNALGIAILKYNIQYNWTSSPHSAFVRGCDEDVKLCTKELGSVGLLINRCVQMISVRSALDYIVDSSSELGLTPPQSGNLNSACACSLSNSQLATSKYVYCRSGLGVMFSTRSESTVLVFRDNIRTSNVTTVKVADFKLGSQRTAQRLGSILERVNYRLTKCFTGI